MPEAFDYRDPGWDEFVNEFESACLFHSSGWLEFLERTRGVKVVAKPLRADGHDGVNVAALTRRGPFHLAGSPLPGWKTMRMGPLVDTGVNGVELAAACERFGRELGVSMYEVVSEVLDRQAFESVGWETERYGTLSVPLVPDADALWNGLKKAVRGRVKKGRSNGLEVRLGVDPALAHDVWMRSDAIMRHKGLRLDWDEEDAIALVDCLAPRDALLGVRVVAEDGHTAACGLFPYDSKSIYYWAGASFAEDRALVPNELMHWGVMEWAARQGLSRYDMYGSGDYKKKYGAELIEHPRGIRYYGRVARVGRSAYAGVRGARRRLGARLAGGGRDTVDAWN